MSNNDDLYYESLESLLSSAHSFVLPDGFSLIVGKVNQYQQALSLIEERSVQLTNQYRRKEFIAGRTIAKEAFRSIGWCVSDIPKGGNGCPIWPEGLLGSISHTKGFCGAYVGIDASSIAVGFDIEKVEPLAENIWSTFTTKAEIFQASSLKINDQLFANILFSAKEACFKALYPIFLIDTPDISQLSISVTPSNKMLKIECSVAEVVCTGCIMFTKDLLVSWCNSRIKPTKV